MTSASCSPWRRCPSSRRSVARALRRQAVPDRPVDDRHAPEPLWQRDQAQSRRAAHRHGRSRPAPRRPVRRGVGDRLCRARRAGRPRAADSVRLCRAVRGAGGGGRTGRGGTAPAALPCRSQGCAAMAGLAPVEAKSSDEDRIAALAARSPDGRLVLWLANLTADEVIVRRPDLPGASAVDPRHQVGAGGGRIPDGRSAARFASAPMRWRGSADQELLAAFSA